MDVINFIEEHQKLLLLYTQKHLTGNVLYVGTGTGLEAALHKQKYGVTPILSDIEDLRHEKALSLSFVRSCIHKLPFEANAFDAVYVQYVLHHVKDLDLSRVLASTARIGKKLIIVEELITPNSNIDLALAHDQTINEIIHPGINMPPYHFLTKEELVDEVSKYYSSVEARLAIKGKPEEGGLDTYVVVASNLFF